MERDYPLAWDYLNRNKKLLEERESGKFKDIQWYRFGRTQNLGMWEQSKLMIPYMITELAAYLDLLEDKKVDFNSLIEKEFLLDLRCYLSFMSIRYSAVNEIASRIRITCLREMFNHRASEERALSVYSFLREKVLPELKKLKPEQEEEKWFYQALKRLCVRFACFYKEAKSQHKVAASSSEEVASASSASSSSSSYNQKSHMRK